MIDPLFEREKISQTNHGWQILHWARIRRRWRKSDTARIDKRNLRTILEHESQISLLRFGVDFLFERGYIAPCERQTFSRRYIDQSRALIIIERSFFVALAPMPHRRPGIRNNFHRNTVTRGALPSIFDLASCSCSAF